MPNPRQQLADALRAAFDDRVDSVKVAYNEVTVEVAAENLVAIATELRDDPQFQSLLRIGSSHPLILWTLEEQFS